MITLAVALAAPPEGVDVEDIARWERLADAALDGPAGCWEVEGGTRATITVQTRASFWKRGDQSPNVSEGRFSGRLRDGVWERFEYTLVRLDDGKPADVSIYPMIGRVQRETVIANGKPLWDEEELEKAEDRREKRAERKGEEPPEGSSDPSNLLRGMLDAFDTSTAISTAGWRDSLNAVQLDQDVPVSDADNADMVHVTTVFPGGAPHPARLSAVFPRKLTVGQWPWKATLFDTQLHLIQVQVADKTLPMAETASTVLNALGFTLGLEQRFDYRSARPCSP